MRKVSVIFGTRPEAIKLAPVVKGFDGQTDVCCHVCVTGQHRQMLDQVLEAFRLEPDTDLDLMQPGQSLAALTARTVEAVDHYLAREKPDLVVVQGDTTTTLAAALVAFYRHTPVAHVEAGLRTGNFQSPWPEEMNRVLTSRLATLHFAATETARKNLLREGVAPASVFVTGNTVVDALMLAVQRLQTESVEVPGLLTDVWQQGTFVLITGHRRENFGTGFESLCRAIAELARRFPEVHFIYPVHLNPNVREPVERILGTASGNNIHLTEPLPYLPFVALMNRCRFILTDSGGIQEEAPVLGKPVLVMRDTTERPEAVAAGTARLVGTDRAAIVAAAGRLLTDPAAYAAMATAGSPYGDGQAARRIVETCTAFLLERPS